MGKKVLKRSLVLGALMAFVITGSAWADYGNADWNDSKGTPYWVGGDEVEILDGKASAVIMDNNHGTKGADVVYLVTGIDEKVNGNIEIETNHSSSGEKPESGEVAAVLLNGPQSGQNILKTTIIGDILYEVEGASKHIENGVFARNNGHYIQKGSLKMIVNDANGAPGVIALRVGERKPSNGVGGFNSVAEKYDGDTTLELRNVTSNKVAVVRVAENCSLTHKYGDINLYAENFAVTSEGGSESVSGIFCRNGGTVNHYGDINMTFINNVNKPNKDNIYGVEFHFGGTVDHDGNINMSFGGEASNLFNSDESKSRSIYAYMAHEENGYTHTYEKLGNNINTISFGAIDASGTPVSFKSSDGNSMTWSFANFDVMKVTDASSFYITSDKQILDHHLNQQYFQPVPGWSDAAIDSTKIQSKGGTLYLVDKELILGKDAKAEMSGLVSDGAKITMGEGAELVVNTALNGDATFAFANLEKAKQVYVKGEVDTNSTYTAEISMDELQEGTKIGHVAVDKNDKSILDKVVGVADDVYESGSAGIDTDGNLINVQKVVASTNIDINSAGTIGLMSWRAEMNDMNKRMGELRNANGEHGVWVRMVRGEAEYKGVKNQYNQYQLGYDEKLSTDPSWTVGAALSYTDGESSYEKGSGENTHKGLAIYGSKLNEDGTFIDLIAKYSRLDHNFKATDAMGDGEYDTNGYSFSAEVGKRIQQGKGLWIEPQVELTYGKVSAVDYVTKKNITVAQDGMESLVGRVGFSIGKDIEQGNVYARASYLYDFDGKSNTLLDGKETLKEDLGGGWWEVGVGANINLSKATYIYADVEKTFGGEVDTNWQWNLGVRYSF